MTLLDQLRLDLTAALKAGESLKAETIRGILSQTHNAEIEKRTKDRVSELTDEEVRGVLHKEAKKRREAIEVYGKAGRSELEEKEKSELAIISSYLPPPLDASEIEALVGRVVENHGEEGFGKVMQLVMGEAGGRADAKDVAEIVKGKLGK